jgi:hypothetical protein
MPPYYFGVDGGAPYNQGRFRDETDSLFLPDQVANRSTPRVNSQREADLIARNRAIARLPFSWGS